MSAPLRAESQAGRASTVVALELSDREFETLRVLIESNLGIRISDGKRSMLVSRIARRLRELSLTEVSQYCQLLARPSGAARELQVFFDLVTTNKTSFFRERPQLDYLAQKVFPDLLRRAARERRPLRVWSAACSTGQEVWTIAMMLDLARVQHRIHVEFKVLGSDVSRRVLKTAIGAKYPAAELADVPPEYANYFMRSKTKGSDLVRVVPALRERAGFLCQNLMADRYLIGDPVDLVLLRNALIYFSRERQHAIVRRAAETLRADGLFVIGLTETLQGLGEPVSHLGHSIYRWNHLG